MVGSGVASTIEQAAAAAAEAGYRIPLAAMLVVDQVQKLDSDVWVYVEFGVESPELTVVISKKSPSCKAVDALLHRNKWYQYEDDSAYDNCYYAFDLIK